MTVSLLRTAALRGLVCVDAASPAPLVGRTRSLSHSILHDKDTARRDARAGGGHAGRAKGVQGERLRHTGLATQLLGTPGAAQGAGARLGQRPREMAHAEQAAHAREHGKVANSCIAQRRSHAFPDRLVPSFNTAT